MKPIPNSAKSAVSPGRAVAYDILLRVERQGAYASELLHAQPAAQLSAADHGLATELVMGVLRWRSRLDGSIAAVSSTRIEKLDLEVVTALRLAVYQLQFMERVPARAAIHESVELVKRARKRSAAAFANAVLRKIAVEPAEFTQHAKEGGGRLRSPANVAEQFSHPAWLVQRWTDTYGIETARAICEYDQQRPQTAIRLQDPAVERELQEHSIELGPGALLGSARRVLAGDVTRTRAFHEGRVAIQDEASQLVAELVGRGARILDCCAAPGGKTSIVAERNPDASVIAVELHPHRARLLRKLVHATNVRVISADARALPLRGGFDSILADVPCSGTGTLARNPDIKWRLRPEDLADLQQRQIAILRAAVAQLAPGGRLVYSTCSLEKEENSQVVERVVEQDSVVRIVDLGTEMRRLHAEGKVEAEKIVTGPYLRTVPGVQPCDGFFAAILEKM